MNLDGNIHTIFGFLNPDITDNQQLQLEFEFFLYG